LTSFSNEVFDPDMTDFMYSLGGEGKSDGGQEQKGATATTATTTKTERPVAGLGNMCERGVERSRISARKEVLREAKPTNYSGAF
jgi:hypothetical protein